MSPTRFRTKKMDAVHGCCSRCNAKPGLAWPGLVLSLVESQGTGVHRVGGSEVLDYYDTEFTGHIHEDLEKDGRGVY